MDRIGVVSKVTGTHGERAFEWVIPEFWQIQNEFSYRSPVFRLSDSSWDMEISKERPTIRLWGRWINLSLRRDDHGAPKTITFTLGIKRGGGFAEATFTCTNCLKWDESSGKLMLVEYQNTIYERRFPTVICRIKCDSPKKKKFVSCANQTEVPDNVSCAIQTEVSDNVSCAIQTEVPDNVSCAIQTEVPGRLINKVNLENDYFSALDTKGITLLSDGIKDLLINGTDYDVKLCVKDKEFRAHRNILSARSPVFAMMLKHDTEENNTGTIRIEDCDPDSFDEFLLYVYSGRTENLTPSKALQLYYPADKYDFPVLKVLCANFLKTSLSVTCICDVIILAAKHGEKELLEVATDYFARNMKEILVTVGWQRFLCQNPVEANELYIKSIEIMLP